jgi:hypothetical protein
MFFHKQKGDASLVEILKVPYTIIDGPLIPAEKC